jgi:hypothetical protein
MTFTKPETMHVAVYRSTAAVIQRTVGQGVQVPCLAATGNCAQLRRTVFLVLGAATGDSECCTQFEWAPRGRYQPAFSLEDAQHDSNHSAARRPFEHQPMAQGVHKCGSSALVPVTTHHKFDTGWHALMTDAHSEPEGPAVCNCIWVPFGMLHLTG